MIHKTLVGDRIRRGTCICHVISGWAVHVLRDDWDTIGQELEAAVAMLSPVATSHDDGSVWHCQFPVSNSRLISCYMHAGSEVDGRFSGNIRMADTVTCQVLASGMTQSDDIMSPCGRTTAPVNSAPGHPVCNMRYGLGMTDPGLNGGSLYDSTRGVDSAESCMDRMEQRHVKSICVKTGSAAGMPSVPVLAVTGRDGGCMREMPAGVVA